MEEEGSIRIGADWLHFVGTFSTIAIEFRLFEGGGYWEEIICTPPL
jgi:hypothetical protein